MMNRRLDIHLCLQVFERRPLMKKNIPASSFLLMIVMGLFLAMLMSCTDEIPVYTVRFNSQGGSAIVEMTALKGSKIAEPKSPIKDNYEFEGWYKDSGLTSAWNFNSDMVTSDITLYAKWADKTYTITFDAQGGYNLSDLSMEVEYGGQYGQLPTVEKAGQTFNGWWTGVGGTGVLIIPSSLVQIQTSQILYAHWIDGYTIYFRGCGGSIPNPEYKAVKFGDRYGSLAATSRVGYVFDGWYTGVEGTGDKITADSVLDIAENKTLYANWVPETYMVTFDAQGGDTPSPTTKNVTHASTYGPLATISREGYTFDGWWTAPEGGGSQITGDSTVSITEEQTLYAKWVANEYTVTFDAQGGINLNPSIKTVKYDDSYGALATTVKVGHALGGWTTGPNGTGLQITSGSTVGNAANHTLYAKWEPNTQTITFDAQGGTSTDPLTKVVTYGQAYGELASTTRESYTFAGWWTGEGGSGTQITEESVFTGTTDRILYAKWSFDVFTGPAGGLVFYENPNYAADGWRYLEAAPYGWYDGAIDSYGAYTGDADPGFQWGAYGYAVEPSARATAIGSGASNTANIVSYHNVLWTLYPEKGDYYTNPIEYNTYNDGTVAAKVCAEYSVEHEGETYDDWFLPSKDELDLMYRNLKMQNLGSFSDFDYWSSSEYYASYAWAQSFSLGYQYGCNSDAEDRVRPVRAF
jgi:uncharacterized repeat protein (TIGR02543 family)